MEKKIKRFATFREDGEPGVTLWCYRLEEPRHFDTIAEAAENLGMEPDDLLDYLEAEQQ